MERYPSLDQDWVKQPDVSEPPWNKREPGRWGVRPGLLARFRLIGAAIRTGHALAVTFDEAMEVTAVR